MTAPTAPFAIYLAGTDHRYRLLAFDFDSGRHGTAVVDADADRLSTHLSALGVPHLRVDSGPRGGQHVWVRIAAPGAAADDVRKLAHALRQHYPSLDTAPLSNPTTGAVRPPGAPHRHGGHSHPHLQGAALGDALTRMAHGTTPEVVTWLLACHPHTPAASQDSRTRPALRIIDDTTGMRLDRPRRPLTGHTRSLLSTTPAPGTDRSALAHSILLGMARAGHALDDVRRAVETAPGLIRLRDDVARGLDETARQWRRALDIAARFAPAAVADRAPVDDELDRIEAAVIAARTHWARPGGASDERILHALVDLARTARTRTLDIDVRRLAAAAALDASTASRRLRVLAAEGWVTRIREAAGTRSATWELTLRDLDATQGEPAPAGISPTLLAHHTHDVWAHTPGLGGPAARIHFALLKFGKPIDSVNSRILEWVVSSTGYTAGTVRKVLDRLHALKLLSPSGSEARMTDAATVIGATGAAARRVRRHLLDRELHRWWTEETEWRTRRGRSRGAAARRDRTAALPIAAPARVRYGRFPCLGSGKADYRCARAIVAEALEAIELQPHSAA